MDLGLTAFQVLVVVAIAVLVVWLVGEYLKPDPMYCPDDGVPIEVLWQTMYDLRTGEPYQKWYWACPATRVYFWHGGFKATSYGSHVHVWGEGKPSWIKQATTVYEANGDRWYRAPSR